MKTGRRAAALAPKSPSVQKTGMQSAKQRFRGYVAPPALTHRTRPAAAA
jgi:hypothetical protein